MVAILNLKYCTMYDQLEKIHFAEKNIVRCMDYSQNVHGKWLKELSKY